MYIHIPVVVPNIVMPQCISCQGDVGHTVRYIVVFVPWLDLAGPDDPLATVTKATAACRNTIHITGWVHVSTTHHVSREILLYTVLKFLHLYRRRIMITMQVCNKMSLELNIPIAICISNR